MLGTQSAGESAGETAYGTASSPDPVSQQPRRRQRSKTGCSTCRTKKVKCDEQHPECARCIKLGLTCQWELHRPSLRERRRESATTRVLYAGQSLRPIAPQTQTRCQVAASACSSMKLSRTLDRGSGAMMEESPPCQSTAVDGLTLISFDDSLSKENVPFLPSASAASAQLLIPSWNEEVHAPWQSSVEYQFDVPFTATPPWAMTNLPVLASIPLNSIDYRALDYYSNTFSAAFTKKNPKWSMLSVLLTFALGDPMVMHLLLAASLNDLWYETRQQDKSLRHCAQQHYATGVRILAERRKEASLHYGSHVTATSHLHILAAFWFLYICKNRDLDIDVNYLQQLSTSVANHIKNYQLEQLCVSGSLAASPTTQAEEMACSARDGALIALMITCVYYQDIKYGFFHCGGKVAIVLNTNKLRLRRIYDLGRNALAVTWGPEYPITELSDDLENYNVLKLQSELSILLEDINCEFGFTRYDTIAEARFLSELENIRARYSGVLDMATNASPSSYPSFSGVSPATNCQTTQQRVQINADLSAAFFHAIRIYIYRCTLGDGDSETPAEVATSLNDVLCIARRVLGSSTRTGVDNSMGSKQDGVIPFHRLEWSLFIAGVESRDVFYRDWIVQRMQKTSTRRALERIVEEQARNGGKRVGVESMRQVFVYGMLGT